MYTDLMSTTAKILTDTDTLDLLASFESVEIPAAKFAEGMILLDELGCPAGLLDHKIGRAAQGSVTWLVEDLDAGGWNPCRFAARKTFTVAAA